jgi:amino acid adenylation domain-containing protein
VRAIGEYYARALASMAAAPGARYEACSLLSDAEQQQVLAEWNATATAYPDDQCLHHMVAGQAARMPDAIAVVFDEGRRTKDEGRRTKDEGRPTRSSQLPSPIPQLPTPTLHPSSLNSHLLSSISQHLTYAELDRRANQLAHYLRTLGVRPEVSVGVCMERSLELPIALLGVLKAGGAYLPLDPAYPRERLTYMLEDAQVPVLLVATKDEGRRTKDEDGNPSFVFRLSSFVNTRMVDLIADWPTISQQPTTNPDVDVAPDDLAYVIYTSGSTGSPKGVLVSHANVVRLFEATRDRMHFDADDVWTLFHSYAFDFSVWEFWGPLLYGGRLVVVPYEVSRAPDAFYQLLCSAQVTVLNQTPSAFLQLTNAAVSTGQTRDLSLRLVIFGGEALESQSLQPWFERYGDQHPQLVNMYGITETTVHVTYRRITIADLHSPWASAIGGPIPDLQLYILDQYLQPVPIGIAGEMYVGGAGLARGYLNRPELTAERFIPNPFVTLNDERRTMKDPTIRSDPLIVHRSSFILYKTGDLARYRPNGDIEYIGRCDQQVKIRGFRIELGEIQAALDKHPGVRDSVVLVREDVPGDRRLVAYIVPTNDQRPTTNEALVDDTSHSSFVLRPSSFVGELRSFLSEWLPEYMLPGAFVLLDALPLTSNGKVDRQALPVSTTTRPELEGQYLAPRTPLEKALTGIWADVLGLERVGIDDNFFMLGGNSLLIVQVHSKLRDQIDRSVSMIELFKYPTIRTLAKRLGQNQSEPSALRQGQSRANARKGSLQQQQLLRQQMRANKRNTND